MFTRGTVNLSSIELERLLEVELYKLGLDHFVVMIIDAQRQPIFQHVCGFSNKQMRIYAENMTHDAFFNHYAQQGYIGQFLYMQEMLPVSKIRDPIFNEILIPTMQLHHSYCGLHPLAEGHYVMLSSHSDKELSHKDNNKAKMMWRFLISWGNYWVAQRNMTMNFRRFTNQTFDILPLDLLTNAEIDVLNMLAQGMDGTEVAKRRNVSKETVRSQIKQILHKTECRHQNQLLSRYFQTGVITRRDAMTLSFDSEF